MTAGESLRALIVDDEDLARLELRRMLDEDGRLQVVGEARHADAADHALARLAAAGETPDVVFLDVVMPGCDGFAWLARRLTVPRVVFVSAHDAYAVAAFRANALDYLVKPVDDRVLADTVQRLVRDCARDRPVPPGEPEGAPRRLFVKDGSRVHLIDLAEIRVIDGEGNYAVFDLGSAGSRPMSLTTLTALEARLPAHEFARANRAQIISLRHARELRQVGEILRVTMDHGREVELSVRRTRELRRRFAW